MEFDVLFFYLFSNYLNFRPGVSNGINIWQSNVQIINSTLENFFNQYFINCTGNFNGNYSLTLQNVYFNNFDAYQTMILSTDMNLIIFNTTFTNISCNGGFISFDADETSFYFVILQNSYFINVSSMDMISLSEANINIVNSTFEGNVCDELLLVSSSNSISFTLQNVKIAKNNISSNGIMISAIIYIILDSFEFSQNYNGQIGFQIENSEGSILFLNSVVFINNYVGNNDDKL